MCVWLDPVYKEHRNKNKTSLQRKREEPLLQPLYWRSQPIIIIIIMTIIMIIIIMIIIVIIIILIIMMIIISVSHPGCCQHQALPLLVALGRVVQGPRGPPDVEVSQRVANHFG